LAFFKIRVSIYFTAIRRETPFQSTANACNSKQKNEQASAGSSTKQETRLEQGVSPTPPTKGSPTLIRPRGVGEMRRRRQPSEKSDGFVEGTPTVVRNLEGVPYIEMGDTKWARASWDVNSPTVMRQSSRTTQMDARLK
jgi:hypothetical protein